MSKHDFTAEEFAARRRRAERTIREAGLDWFVLFHPVTIRWLTGSDAKSYQEFQCLVVFAEPKPYCILTREGERNEFREDALVDEISTWGGGEIEDPVAAFARFVSHLGLQQSKGGMEVPAYYLHPHHYLGVKDVLGGALAAERNFLIHDLTLAKSAAELVYIRHAVRIADEAMAVFAAELVVGKSELQIAGAVYETVLAHGGGIAASPINLVSGERSAFSHGAPTNRRLRRGDFGNVEFGATYRHYTATVGRQFSIGKPSPRMLELYALVRAAGDACRAEIRGGVPAAVPHRAAKKVIGAAGLERCRVHTTGYGLAPGFPPTWGESNHLLDDSTYTLEPGMVLTIEPPVFIGEEGLGARLINNVLVTPEGSELLTRYSPDLIIVP